MANVARWHDIECSNCGNKDLFGSTSTYRWHPTGGTSKGLETIRCLKCLTVVSPADQERQVRRENLKRQMDELDAENTEKQPMLMGKKSPRS